MILNMQIKTILASVIFGIFFKFILNINQRIVYKKNIFIKIIGTFFLTFLNTILYFIIIMKINNAVFHIYEILCIILGMIIFKSIENYIKK